MLANDAFCEQIRRQEKAMYSLALSVVGNETDAQDVLCEAIFRAYKSLDTLRDADAFRPWILKIVHNTAVEWIRKNAKTVFLHEVEIVKDSHENRLVTTLPLKAAVESLRQPYRTVVVLYYYEEMPMAQIAKITGTTIVTVKQRLSRARKQLREILKEDFRDE